MGTRSNLIVSKADGTFARVYIHFDGYPTGVGAMLAEHYASQERAEKVVSHGDMSSLKERCDRPDGHSYESPVKGCTVYFGRDRGEDGVDARIFKDAESAWAADDYGAEYIYFWNGTEWLVGDADNLTPVTTVLSEQAA